MAKSTYHRNNVQSWTFKGVAMPTAPTTIYVSYHTADPGLTGANEVSGNAYARVGVANANWATVSAGLTSNSVAVTHPAPTPANWGTLTYVGYWDALTTGNFLEGNALTNPVTTSIGVAVTAPIGALTSTES